MKNKELDLHGVKHQDVPREIDKFIGAHLMSGSREVYIVTGHSKKMKDLTKKTLADYQLNSQEDTFNKGMLIVSLV